MFKPQLKFQKILFVLLLILSAVCFVYSLGLMTNLYGLYQTKAMGGVTGYEIFYDMQDYNKYLVNASIGLICISCLPFIFGSNTRRKYYKGNIISTYVHAASYVAVAAFIIVENIKFRAQFLNTVDFAEWEALANDLSFNYSTSTFFFDAGFVVACLLVVAAGVLVYNLNWKNKLMKQEERILKGEVENG